VTRDRLRVPSPGGGTLELPVVAVSALIVGGGAAGLKCALSLHRLGVTDIALVTDRPGGGASANSGSDKQTYYKPGVSGNEPDGPMEMARTLFAGGMMHGDTAYIEALGSLPAFFALCELGVPFPANRYGGYVGYKTDHDPRQRATSAGPRTSQIMVEKLAAELRRRRVRRFPRLPLVRLLVDGTGGRRRIAGALCLDPKRAAGPGLGLTVFAAPAVVLATGGPGEMFRESVWPAGQAGALGLALEAGARGANLTELQYGLASLGFRWNLSGSYQQVIPDYFSTGPDGSSDRRAFLPPWFESTGALATAIFLKGYQWPFHAARLGPGGSSRIDLAVLRETERGRRVFLDFSRNPTPGPGGEPFSLNGLGPEARAYLERSGALQGTPHQRLGALNPEAIRIFADHGVDLRRPLEATVCAQHANGGLAVDGFWETGLPGLFAVGEAAGTHGLRPGGSALNSGQVGALRAAERIARLAAPPPPAAELAAACGGQVVEQLAEFARFLAAGPEAMTPREVRREIQERMSRAAGPLRNPEECRAALAKAEALYARLRAQGICCSSFRQLARAREDLQLALTHLCTLAAMAAYLKRGGGSRGGCAVLDPAGPLRVVDPEGGELRLRPENAAMRNEILEAEWRHDRCAVRAVPVRPLPEDDSWFETVWRERRQGKI
jgi:succinate dehydrogenase/fumarate reductase flavoprotein subunit